MLNELAKQINDTAREKGFWYEDRNKGECIALMHSELSEALEEIRRGKDELYYGKGAESVKPEGYGIELADCIIRILDFCHAYGINIDRCVQVKMLYNKSRAYMHGKKF